MKVYVVMKHDFFTGGDSVVDSVWLNERDAVSRESEIDNERDYVGETVEMEAK